MIVPENQTDADRIADFVNGYLGGNIRQNKDVGRKVLHIAEAVLVYKVARTIRKAKREAGRRR